MDNQKSNLVPIEQQSISFYGDVIQAVRMSDGLIYIAVRPICKNLGIDWSSQRKKLTADPILAAKLISVVFNTTEIDPMSKRPKSSSMLALPLQFIQGWLFRIDSRRVKATVRADLIRYQEQCYAVLAQAFSPEKSKIGRLYQLYKKAGHDEKWIEYRLQSIRVRQALTAEWKERGVQNDEYAILTNEISKGTFDLTTSEHKELKELESQNLRDHMSNLELVFTMLGEASTTEIAQKENAQGFAENLEAAHEGGKIAGDARQALELQTGESVISDENFLPKNTQPPLLDD